MFIFAHGKHAKASKCKQRRRFCLCIQACGRVRHVSLWASWPQQWHSLGSLCCCQQLLPHIVHWLSAESKIINLKSWLKGWSLISSDAYLLFLCGALQIRDALDIPERFRRAQEKGEALGDGVKCWENADNTVMAARAEGQARILSHRTKHSKRDGQREEEKRDAEEENSSSWLAAKIIWHNGHDTGS